MNATVELETALRAVRAGEKLLVGELPSKPRRPESLLEKGPHDYQTNMDILVEERMAAIILDRFPDHGIEAEESGRKNPGSANQWFLDPIDGTRNYVEGRPDIAISLAHYRNGEPVVGIISMPCRGLVVAAERGRPGLTVNGQPFRRSRSPRRLSEALIGIKGDIRSPAESRLLRGIVEALASRVEGFRITGALAYDLACVALGEIAARFSVSTKNVDIAAGAFIVAKSGGAVTDISGHPWTLESGSILAATSRGINSALVKLLSKPDMV